MPKISSINPYSGETHATFETLTDQQIQQKIENAQSAFSHWKNTSFTERRDMFHSLADVIEEDYEETAKLQTQEMWMLYSASLQGMKWTITLIRWFADNAETYLGAQDYELNGTQGKMLYDPLGVIFGIGPWNFPYNQILRAAVPNILAGNTQLYKHASNVPLCALQIEKWFLQAGFPEGVYQNLFMSSAQSEFVISHKYVKWVNLTGGERAWSVIGALAGKYLKPSVLELGGNDPFVVASHKDTKKMAVEAVKCRNANGGQKCNSSKRFIVPGVYYDEFVAEMTEVMKSQKIGDPMQAETQIPPMARTDLVQEIDDQVQQTLQEWARLMCGGKILWDRWEYYAPTVLADVTPEMTSYRQEVFGPVASIVRVKDIDEAIHIANESEYGLSAAVYGDDEQECRLIAERLEGGMIFINQWAASKPHLSFWWVKKSGYGKENGPEGLRAFTNKKIIIY